MSASGCALAAALLALALPGGTARATAPVPWTTQAQQLIGRLPVSVSVGERGRLVYAHAGNVRRPPASDEKLLLSIALLDRFGPRYRIPTTVESTHPAEHGRVPGNVWLVGHGDPELNESALERLAHKLRASGIHGLRGSIIGVTDTFTRERWASGWRPIALQFIALPTALTFEANSDRAGFAFDPERRAAAALTVDLRALGVGVRRRAHAGREPSNPRHVIATIRSAPLVDILRRQNRDSLNLDAEVLTKMLGAATLGPPGSIAKGARAIQAWASRQGVELIAHDGSGLSYTNAVSTNAIVRLLSVASRQPWGPALRSTLPTGGEGTLAGRLPGLDIRAKTGTLLQQVSALSGWVRLRTSNRWAEFSILSRGLSKPRAVALEDALVTLIAQKA